MKTRNEQIENLLFGYFAGELTGIQEEELLAWLKADEANPKVLSDMADWWATAHVPLFASERKADFEKHFGHLMPSPQLKSAKHTMWNRWMKIAAVGLLVLSVGITSYRIGQRETDHAESTYFETIIPLGSQAKVILPDQSAVWVNAGSSLRYSKDFNQKTREIILEGEAYFEVTRDTLKPFVVKSDVVSIKVLGTCFNVKAYKDDETVDVSLVSGKVNVHLTNNTQHAGEVELKPNRMLSYNKGTERVAMNKINGKEAYDWTNGTLRFDGQSFLQIAKDLERKYNISIHIESKKLKQEVFTGSFSGAYALDDVLREIDVEHRYNWKRIGDKLTISDN